MNNDELIIKIYDLERYTNDVEAENQLIKLGYSIKKYGISGTTNSDTIISEESIHVDYLFMRLDEISEIVPEPVAKLKINEMRSEIISKGIDGYVRSFWNY